MRASLIDKPISELTITIVGGGNAAHALGALLPHKGVSTRIWAPFSDEAERINNGISQHGQLCANFAKHNAIKGEVFGRPDIVSKEAQEVIPGSDVLLLPLPSFAYHDVFTQIKPYLRAGMAIGITPGQGGVDWVAKQVLGPLFDQITLFSIMPMPFNCRISEFGVRVEVQELKQAYQVACTPVEHSKHVIALNEALFGQTQSCGDMLAAALYPINAVIHPARLYQLAKDYQEGDKLPENPLFYEQMDSETAGYMNQINQELLAISKPLQQAGANIEIPHIKTFLAEYVYHDTATTLEAFFSTNPAYKGFRCPLIAVDGGFVPDFNNRYFTEDIPLGLCLYKGVAELVNVKTPFIDEIITWAQNHMGKEYLVNGRLSGKDIGETAAPQRFGVTDVQSLIS